jgi:aliphatic nitrilase
MKLRHDFAGHYNRPDVFRLQVSTANPSLLEVNGGASSARPEPPAPPELLQGDPRPQLGQGELDD